jgi:hypothetical protein
MGGARFTMHDGAARIDDDGFYFRPAEINT